MKLKENINFRTPVCVCVHVAWFACCLHAFLTIFVAPSVAAIGIRCNSCLHHCMLSSCSYLKKSKKRKKICIFDMTGFDRWELCAHTHTKEILLIERTSRFFLKNYLPQAPSNVLVFSRYLCLPQIFSSVVTAICFLI